MLCHRGNLSTNEHVLDDALLSNIISSFLCLVSILASVWNIWVIHKVVVIKPFHTASYILFANVCASELVGSSLGSITVVCILLFNYESYVTILAGSFILPFCLTVCLLSIFMVAVDTWMKLSHPVKYVEKVSLRKVVVCMALMWSVSTIISSALLVRFYIVTKPIRKSSRSTSQALCFFVREVVTFTSVFVAPVALAVSILGIYTGYTAKKHLNAVVPFLVQPALPRDESTPRVDGVQAQRLGQQPPRRRVDDPETHASRDNIRYAVLFLTFGLVWIPLCVVNSIKSHDDNMSNERAFLANVLFFIVAFTWMYITTTTTLLRSEDFQTALKQDLRWLRDKLTRLCK